MNEHLLSLLIFLPLLGALLIFFFVKEGEEGAGNAKSAALWTTIATFAASLLLLFRFDGSSPEFQFVEQMQWVKGYGIGYHLGVDGISLFMILLTTFLMPICILCSWNSIRERVREYMMAFLVLETFVIGVFCALDMLLFYIFFEGMLIPMYLIIGIWGGQNRIYAAYKFFLYTLAGSLLLLAAMLYLYLTFGTTSIPALMEAAPALPLEVQQYLWLAMLASFAVKVPMWRSRPTERCQPLPPLHIQAAAKPSKKPSRMRLPPLAKT